MRHIHSQHYLIGTYALWHQRKRNKNYQLTIPTYG